MAKHHSTIKCGVLVYHPELNGLIIARSDHEAHIGREYPRLKRPDAGHAGLSSGGHDLDSDLDLAQLTGRSQAHPTMQYKTSSTRSCSRHAAWRPPGLNHYGKPDPRPRPADRPTRRRTAYSSPPAARAASPGAGVQ